jgi:carboxypeptidase C (cathepsin A)
MSFTLFVSCTVGAPSTDHVTSLPGFDSWPFDLYSGYLNVPGPFQQNDYDSLEIHYQFHTSQNDPAKDPLVTWHQGGPGSSSINLGLYTEMGYFQIDDQGTHTNAYAWNRVANMLYLESPAGSGSSNGFSACIKAGAPVRCEWDDSSQAEAYAHSLAAFHKAFPEFASHELYLTGER